VLRQDVTTARRDGAARACAVRPEGASCAGTTEQEGLMTMHVVVVGCGRVGAGLATELEREGHSVAIIDKLQRAFRRLPPDWGGQKVVGFGFDKEHLDEAGAGHADALAAVTSGDNSNILTARIARETYDIANVVARIYDPRRAEIFQRLGIPTVPSVTWTIDQVFRRILPGEGTFEWTDGSGQLHLVERPMPAPWAGKKIVSLLPDGVRLVSVVRALAAVLHVDDLVGQDGDVLYLAVTDASAGRLAELFEGSPAPGGGRAGDLGGSRRQR
jgi:trk system potassium uptake protein TrkA